MDSATTKEGEGQQQPSPPSAAPTASAFIDTMNVAEEQRSQYTRIDGAQASTQEQLQTAVENLREFSNESERLLHGVSDNFAAHTVTVLELSKAVAQLEQRVVQTKQRAMAIASKHDVDVATLLPERDDDF